ncbi:MAG TPA: adenylate kinase [Candidatus Binatia bacterium]
MGVLRVVFFGPPGAGKGTQARLLQQKFGACQVSTGEILRTAAREQSALGKQAADYLDRGDLVPDQVMVKLVAERLREPDCQGGFILDGFPRTIAQADQLEKMLKDSGLPLESALCIQASKDVLIKRLSGRRTCKKCGNLHHTIFDPPARPGLCNRCGGELYQREDDREEMIAARLGVYENQTAPLKEYYRKRGLLKEIDGVGSVEEVRKRVLLAVT